MISFNGFVQVVVFNGVFTNVEIFELITHDVDTGSVFLRQQGIGNHIVLD
jgi:hypothetical protein